MSNNKRPRRQRRKQQLVFQEKEQQNSQQQPQQEQKQEQSEQKQQQQEELKPKFTVIIKDGICVRERKLLKSKSNPSTVYKIEHNVWFNRARRRWKKSQHFSDMA